MSSAPTVSPPDQKQETRFTWYLVVLITIHFLLFLLTIRARASSGAPKYPVATFAFVLAVQWVLFYVAYRGIRASGNSLPGLLGQIRLWSDCKDGLVVLLLGSGMSLFLMRLQRPPHSAFYDTKTLWQYSLVILIAVTAGFTEEVTFRGFFFIQLQVLTGNLRVALYSQALLFALVHGARQTLSEMAYRFTLGLLFAFFARQRDSLWPAIFGHAFIDILAMTVRHFRHG